LILSLRHPAAHRQLLCLAALLLQALGLGGCCCSNRHPPASSPAEALDRVVTTAGAVPPRYATGHDLLILNQAVDYTRLRQWLEQRRFNKAWRRRQVPEILAALARRSQVDLLAEAQRLLAAGRLRAVHPLQIVNWVAVEGEPRAIEELAHHPDVAGLLPARSLLPDPRPFADPPSEPIEVSEPADDWALRALGVPAARQRGLSGKGVRIGIADTGVDGELEQLAPGLAAGGWFDPVSGRSQPWDASGHGTQVLALAVAHDSQVGVAPGAQWLAALSNPANRLRGIPLARSLDFMLQQRPDILILAFGSRAGECHRALTPFLNALLAAEVFVVMAAGNEGPNPGTDISPANLSGLYPGDSPGFAVGAVDQELDPLQRSGRGPRSCDLSQPYPLVVAPGLNVRTFSRGGSSIRTSGSSGATGLVAGAAALLLEAAPELSVTELADLLTASARDLRPPGVDRYSGYGLVDLERALETLEGAPGR
jgi:hypothetical protein